MYYKPGPMLQKFIDSITVDYDFHPVSCEYPYLKWLEFCELAEDLAENGLKGKIELLDGKILDGKHRYLACLMKNIKPQFIVLPENINPRKHAKSRNYHRRHLTRGQKLNFALAIYDEEKVKAEERKKNGQFAGKNKNNNPKRNSSVATKRGTAEQKSKKGRTIDKAAKESGLDRKTVSKGVKIAKAAKKDGKMKVVLEKVLLDEMSVEEGLRVVEPPLILNRRTDCNHFEAVACSKCYAQLMACGLELKGGKLKLKKMCPDPCLDFNND